MQCLICGNDLNKGLCNHCGFKSKIEKPNLLKKIFSKSVSHPIPFSDEIHSLILFWKWKIELFSSDQYISRSLVDDYYAYEMHNVSFFQKMNKSGDLKAYCSKYAFSMDNVLLYLDIYKNFYSLLKNRNEEYIKKTLNNEKQYLDNILSECDTKLRLDDEQRRVVLTDEDHNIVIAGAGAGKTTTVAAKVKYLVDKRNIKPEDILIISFTNKAVKELKERINKQLGINCPIATFHSAGRAIILKDTTTSASQIEKDNFWPIHNYLTSLVIEDKELLSQLILLYGYYLDIPEEFLEKLSKEDFLDYKERKDYTTLKSSLHEVNQTIIDARTREQKTIKNEFLRSIQEVQIANFLYLNNIDYEYEKPYKFKILGSKKIYTPDFYIIQGDKICYLEHFGISEDYKNDRYTEEELAVYIANMKDKIHHHEMYGTELIWTFSKYNDKRSLIEHLEEELIKKGFVLKRKSDDEVYEKIKTHDQEKYIMRFSMLASRFIHLFKTRDYHQTDFSVLRAKNKNPRNILFLNILEKVYLYYQNYLKEKKAIDFEDMINESTKLLKEAKSVQKQIHFKYIIIDEYQDISRQRFNLVKALHEICEAKICVVGDDWQSIYAFSGSEIDLFRKFETEMGYAEVLKITNTYRNSQELIDIAGGFIQKNTSQIPKKLKSDKTIKKPVVVFTYSDIYSKNEKPGLKGVQYEKAKLLEDVIGKIIQVDGWQTSILLIGRYGFDGDQLCRTGLFESDKKGNQLKSKKFPQAKLTFLTAHSSKGLTYDNVIIINATHARYGFPSQIDDDPILKCVMVEDKNYEYAEERRLFYVALTRTKNRVFILAPQTRPSKFVLELLNDYDGITIHGEIEKEIRETQKIRSKCPKCGYPLQLKQSKGYGLKLYICTNEPELCDFMTNDMRSPGNIHCCNQCNGYMIVKKAKDSNHYFMGCTNYRHDKKGCNHIEEISIE